MDDVSILVLSCDSYMDALEPFFILKDRYWTGCSYKTYVSTETVVPKYGISLRHNYPISMWTRRIRESLKEIDTKYVILMDSDFFIRNQVQQERIDYCLSQFDDNTITFSFELEYSPTLPSNKDGFRIKPNKYPLLPCWIFENSKTHHPQYFKNNNKADKVRRRGISRLI